MEQCKQCGKDLIQTVGRRKKEFCNETCRSAFWYGKNKKGKKTDIKDLNKQTNEVKPPTPPKTNYTINTTKKKSIFDGLDTADEKPLSKSEQLRKLRNK